MLEIRPKFPTKSVQIMTHTVVGYPTLAASEKIITALAESGSDFIELQIPFSDPVADGPTIAAANEIARQNGVTARDTLTLAARMTKQFPATQFYVMSYLNPILAGGGVKFLAAAKKAGVCGFIIPDLPLEEASEFLAAAKKLALNLIFVVAPNTNEQRLKKILAASRGFVYCVARLGVTGRPTSFSTNLKNFLTRVRKFTTLPLAVGFGVSERADVEAIQKAGGQIAVVGSALLRAYKEKSVAGVARLVRSLQ